VSHPSQTQSPTSPRRSEVYFNRARASLRQAVQRYARPLRLPKNHSQALDLQSALRADRDRLTASLDKLDQSLIRIAVFGLVSRGKSALINALVGQKLLQTGPLHGVTRWPRSVYWSLDGGAAPLQVELIDTPGLDEVGGDVRAEVAREVAYQADLILFVIAGDVTRTEYQALVELQQAQKPILIVFNKADLYPDQDRQTIYRKLETLFAGQLEGDRPCPISSPNEIVLAAADPAPIQVRVELPDGQVTYEWEAPPPQVQELKQTLADFLHREGKTLLALNALRQARTAQVDMAQKTLHLYQDDADELIWRFARWKAIAVAANPIAVLDLLGGAAADLVMIRSLARLYGLPMTGYEATKLWNAIVWSSGSLLLGEVGSGLLLGFGKSTAAIASAFDSAAGLAAYGSTAIAQATLAGYGSFRVGKAAQAYLQRGCTWGPQGADTLIQAILDQIDADTVMRQLQKELSTDGAGDQTGRDRAVSR